MLTTNENLPSSKIDVYRPSQKGAEEQYSPIELVKISVSSIRSEQVDHKHPESISLEPLAFVHQQIVGTSDDGGMEGSDDWQAPPQ